MSKVSTTKANDSSTNSSNLIANGSSKSEANAGVNDHSDANEKRKSIAATATSSSSKHLKDRGKKLNWWYQLMIWYQAICLWRERVTIVIYGKQWWLISWI